MKRLIIVKAILHDTIMSEPTHSSLMEKIYRAISESQKTSYEEVSGLIYKAAVSILENSINGD